MAYQIGNIEVEGYGYMTFFTLNIVTYFGQSYFKWKYGLLTQ